MTGLSLIESFFSTLGAAVATSSTFPPASFTAFRAPFVRPMPCMVNFLVTSPERNILAFKDILGIKFAAFNVSKSTIPFSSLFNSLVLTFAL